MTIKSILATTFPAVTTVVGLCIVLMASTHAHAELLKRVTKNHGEVNIGGYARFNNNCDATESPEVYLDVAPTNGLVCARMSTVTVRIIHEGKADNCVGRSIRGIRIVYLPRPEFSGVEVVRYTVKFNKIKQTMDVDIDVASDQIITENRDGASSLDEPQTQGPVPVCAALVS